MSSEDSPSMSPSTPEPGSAGRWYTTSEVAQQLGLGYTTVQNYARELGDQLQTRRGEKNRLYFSEADVEILRDYRDRPRASGLTLGQIAAQLGIPSDRLRRVADQLKTILPRPDHAKRGFYAPEAAEILRRQLARSARKLEWTNEATGYWRMLAGLRVAAHQLGQISRDLKSTFSRLRQNPPSVTAFVYTLPAQDLVLMHPIAVLVSPLRRTYWRASLPEAKLQGVGKTVDDAVVALQVAIVSAFRDRQTSPELRATLHKLVWHRRLRQGAPTKAKKGSRRGEKPT